jgi:hypothetical protein
MLVINAAIHTALRRVFVVVRAHRDGSELTVTMPVDGEPARANRLEGLGRSAVAEGLRAGEAQSASAAARARHWPAGWSRS